MLSNVMLWLSISPGMIMTILGIICFVATFIFLIKTLWENVSGDTSLIKLTKPTEEDDWDIGDSYIEFTEFFAEPEPMLDEVRLEPPGYTKYEQDLEIADIVAYERVKLMFDVAPLIIQYWDSEYTLIDYNKTAEIFYKLPDVSMNLNEFLKDSEPQPCGTPLVTLWRDYLGKAFEDGFAKFEYMPKPLSGTMYLEVIARRLEAREKYVVVTYTRDITSEKEMMREKEEKALAQANSQAKSRFLANMSHEIRTPISSIIGLAEIQLYNRSHSEAAKDAFKQIYNFSNTLTGILNDVLDLSKIEAGKMDIVKKDYDVAYLIQDVTQMHAVGLEHKRFKFVVSVDENLPETLSGDQLRIKQVLNNVISNSFKYTETGKVQLNIGFAPSGDARKINMVIKVIDTGRGMTEEQVNKLLSEDYVRFDASDNPHVQGTGIGISIVQNLINLMHGKIEVSSTPNSGTKVTLTIPQTVVSDKAIGIETATSLEKFVVMTNELSLNPTLMPWGRVLVVDDMASNLHVARGLLEIFELQVETTLTAANAIDRIASGEVYDIVFIDHMMPDIDGIVATKRIREMGYEGVIIALSANVLLEQEFLHNGFDNFLAKPIKTTVLHEFLLEYIKPLGAEKANNKVDKPAKGLDEYFRRPEVIKMIQKDFLDNQTSLLPQIKEALSKDDFGAARILLHTTRNRALLLDAKKLAKVSEVIEYSFAKGESVGEELLDELGTELNEVLASLA